MQQWTFREKPGYGELIDCSHWSMDRCVGWWRFHERGGRMVTDSSPYRNSSTFNSLASAANWTSGPRGGPAMFFDNFNDYITVPAPSGSILDVGVNHSVFCRLLTFGSSGTVAVNRYNWNGEFDHDIHIDFNGGNVGFNTGDQGSTDFAISNNIWYDVLGTYDGSTIRLYVDGDLKDTDSSSSTKGTSSSDWLIGSDNDHFGPIGNFWDGYIDEVRIWNRTLNAAEVQQLYRNPGEGFRRRNTLRNYSEQVSGGTVVTPYYYEHLLAGLR